MGRATSSSAMGRNGSMKRGLDIGEPGVPIINSQAPARVSTSGHGTRRSTARATAATRGSAITASTIG